MIGDECPIDAALTVGLPPIVKDWLLHNQSEKAKEWREKFKLAAAYKIELANWRQFQIQIELRENPPPNDGPVRWKACVDPDLMNDMRKRYKRDNPETQAYCWHD